MIDPATGWIEIKEITTKHAEAVANVLEKTWLTRYPRPSVITLDQGKEFMAEVTKMIRNDYGKFNRGTCSPNNFEHSTYLQNS